MILFTKRKETGRFETVTTYEVWISRLLIVLALIACAGAAMVKLARMNP